MATATDVIDWAKREIGTAESPKGSNKVKYWQLSGMSLLNGQPWCGAFVTAAYKQNDMSFPSFSYTPSGRLKFKALGRLYDKPQVGDVAFYQFGKRVDHCGIVIEVHPQYIVAIEGNTSGNGSQTNGGEVCAKQRLLTVCRGFGRPNYSGPTPVPQPQPTITYFPGDKMRRIDNPARKQDEHGNGWYELPDTDAMKVVSVVPLGSYPPVDGYWNLPVAGRQQRGNSTIITLTEADPNATELISVWIAD